MTTCVSPESKTTLHTIQHSMRPKIIRSGEGETIKFISETVTWKTVASDTNGRFALAEALIAPGEGPAPHVHQDEDEVFIILEGEVTFLVGNMRYVGRPGDVFFGPRGTVHRFGSDNGRPGRLVVFVMPPRLTELFGRVLAPERPDETMQDIIARMVRLAPEYGLTTLPNYPMPSTVSPVPAAKEHLWVADHRVSLLIDGTESVGCFTVNRMIWPQNGSGLPMHIHHQEDEVLVIIDRQFQVIMGEASSILAPGDIAFVPRGTAHTIRKVGEGVGRAVSIHTPGGVEHFFREIGTPARADDFTSVPPLTHTSEQLAGICARHKMSMLD